MKDTDNASFAFSRNMLRTLLKMHLITKDEYVKIIGISKEYYKAEIYCV